MARVNISFYGLLLVLVQVVFVWINGRYLGYENYYIPMYIIVTMGIIVACLLSTYSISKTRAIKGNLAKEFGEYVIVKSTGIEETLLGTSGSMLVKVEEGNKLYNVEIKKTKVVKRELI